MKIVIIEDDALIAFQIESCLQRLGHSVLGSFSEASTALEYISSDKPDFVFMDIELEGAMDGIQCATVLKSNYKIPSLFVTSHDETEVIEEATSLEPLNFLTKPFTDKNLEASVALASVKLKKQISASQTSIVSLGDYTFHFEYNILKLEENIVKLSPNEMKLMYLLFKNLGHTVSIEEFQSYIWEGKSVSSAAFRKLISRANESLIGLNISSHKGIGYYLESSV